MPRLVAAILVATSVPLSAFIQGQRPEPPQAPDTADVQMEGEVEVDVEDGFDGARVHHRLVVSGKRVTLRFEGTPPHLRTGDRIRARGRFQNDTLTLSSNPSSVETLVSVAPNTFGEQRTLVMLVNFRNQTSQPYGWSTAQQVTFGTVSEFFQENSYGQTWLTGDVVGWFTIDMDAPASSCDYSRIATLAEGAASAAGTNVSNYRRRVIAFPSAGGCGWWGLGNVGGSVTRAWINGSYALKVVAHELGHNFGDYHSNSMPCDAGGCSPVEYGDSHDVMGNPSSGHLNAFQKERLGWLDYGSSPDILSVTAAGAYWIDAMSVAGSAAKALRILKSVDGSGKRTWYYVEARAQAGFDSGVAPGVLVHTGSEATGNSSFQVDLLPTTSTVDRVLDVGQTFSDAQAGLSITTTSAGQSGAWVQVSYAGAPCVTASAGLSLLPGPNVSVADGQPANYTLRVKNNDSDGCASTTFSLGAAVPAGWSSSFGTGSVQLPAGATTDVALTIVPSSTTGTHSFTASATRQGTSGPGGSTTGSVTLIGAIEASLRISRTGPNYQLSVTVQSGSAAVSGATVRFEITKPDGSVATQTATTNSSGEATMTFKPNKKAPRGLHQVLATATSGSMSVSASGSFTN